MSTSKCVIFVSMKKLLLIPVLLFVLTANAQQLANTTWDVYNSLGANIAKPTFGLDSIYVSGSAFVEYNENSLSNFWSSDNPFGSCSGDTGYYSFAILNDTLIFTTVNDLCLIREDFFAQGNVWTRVLAGIDNKSFHSELKLYPNPAASSITIDGIRKSYNLSILDALGRLVYYEKNVLISSKTLNINYFNSGLYFLQLEVDGQVITKKLVKE